MKREKRRKKHKIDFFGFQILIFVSLLISSSSHIYTNLFMLLLLFLSSEKAAAILRELSSFPFFAPLTSHPRILYTHSIPTTSLYVLFKFMHVYMALYMYRRCFRKSIERERRAKKFVIHSNSNRQRSTEKFIFYIILFYPLPPPASPSIHT